MLQVRQGRVAIHRGDLTAYIARHDRAWELAMGGLALVYLSISFLEDGSAPNWLQPAVFGFVFIFALEFAIRCWDSPSRWRYARDHWLDIISCIPLVGGLRALRLLRLVRVVIPLKVLTRVADRGLIARNSMAFLIPSLLLLWVGSAYCIWLFEHDVNPHIHTFSQALYWSFITVTSLGYGSSRAVTTAGQLLAGVLVFLGVGLVGAASARLTAMWMHDTSSGDLSDVQSALQAQTRHEFDALHEAIMGEMNQLRIEVTQLRTLLVLALHEQLPAALSNEDDRPA